MADTSVADFYRRFAALEARGVSDTYFDWASGIADDEDVISLVAPLEGMKKQPNLVFAAARFVGAPIGPYSDFREWLLENWQDVEPVILKRATQTNEAARCAVLLPVLSRINGPLSLIEVGASAGLCLYPDKYSYRYRTSSEVIALDPATGTSPVEIPCSIDEDSVPTRLPDVVWRSGVDLNPLAPGDPDARAWLRTLVWPEHDERRARLEAALEVAAADPPELIRGDLLQCVPSLISSAPSDSRIVVFHSSVLAYVDLEDRERFAALMRSIPSVIWISNEGERVLPRVLAQLHEATNGKTVLAVNEEPVALVGPHGQSYQAL